jgi:cysteinyl-tRNA synthetase
MSGRYLGEVFDIHGGGLDLIFPHHDNEIAQSRCAHGTSVMANVWMHNGFLQVEGQKMSKSLGNFFTIAQLLETADFGGRPWPGDVLRFAMLKTHYRQPIDWTSAALEEGLVTLERLYQRAQGAGEATVPEAVLEPLADDLNTPLAISKLFSLDDPAALRGALALLGLSGDPAALRRAAPALDEEKVRTLINARLEARKARNWAESDRLRDELAGLGIAIKDNKDGTTSWEVKP